MTQRTTQVFDNTHYLKHRVFCFRLCVLNRKYLKRSSRSHKKVITLAHNITRTLCYKFKNALTRAILRCRNNEDHSRDTSLRCRSHRQGCDSSKFSQPTWLKSSSKKSQLDLLDLKLITLWATSPLARPSSTLHRHPHPYLIYHNSTALSTLTLGTSLRQISELFIRSFRCKYVERTSVLMLFMLSRDITWSQIAQNEPMEPYLDFISIFIASA